MAWLDTLLNGYQVTNEDADILIREYGSSKATRLIRTAPNQYHREGESYPSVVFLNDNGEALLVVGNDWYRKKSLTLHYLQTGLLVFAVLMLLIAAVALPVRLFGWIAVRRSNRQQRKPAPSLMLFGSAAILLIGGLAAMGSQPMLDWGRPTAENITFFLCSLLFGAGKLGGTVIVAWECRKKRRWFLRMVAISQTSLAVFLLMKGIIGLRFWLY